jgi:hypothetical protein
MISDQFTSLICRLCKKEVLKKDVSKNGKIFGTQLYKNTCKKCENERDKKYRAEVKKNGLRET